MEPIQMVNLKSQYHRYKSEMDGHNARRREIAGLYTESCKTVESCVAPSMSNDKSVPVFHQYTLQIKEGLTDELAAFLFKRGIPTMIYYPLPLHQQVAYKTDEVLPVSEQLCREVLSLPICPELKQEQQLYIIENLK